MRKKVNETNAICPFIPCEGLGPSFLGLNLRRFWTKLLSI